MKMYNMLLANIGGGFEFFPALKIILLVIMAVCALFIIAVVLFQPGNSSGIGALGGSTETFFSKNKGKTKESKMKKLTAISAIVFAVFAILFCVLQMF